MGLNDSRNDAVSLRALRIEQRCTARILARLAREPGPPGPRGPAGPPGDIGPKPDHEWDGTSLRFEKPDGTWGQYADLRGEKGDKGERGEAGPPGAAAIIGGGVIVQTGNSYNPAGWD